MPKALPRSSQRKVRCVSLSPATDEAIESYRRAHGCPRSRAVDALIASAQRPPRAGEAILSMREDGVFIVRCATRNARLASAICETVEKS